VLFALIALVQYGQERPVRACYLHACLKYVMRRSLTNTSLRERFGIDEKNSAVASRLIKEAVEAGAIVPYDSAASKKYMKYVPWWATAPKGGL
jgi:ATP-dependent DNA helicase RecG